MDRLRPRRLRRDHGPDDGFSLLESVIALAVATVVFTGLATAMISSVQAVLVGRTVQQAGDVGARALENVRAGGFDAVAMRAADLGVNEPLNIAASGTYDPIANAATGPAEEDLVLDDAGGVYPHVVAETINSTPYTIRTYVTRPNDATTAGAKRITVVVSWRVRTEERTRSFSTLMTETRRGLPLPDYKWVNNGPTYACVSPGATAVLGFTLTNNGARDSWSVSSTGGSMTWNYYLDDGAGSPGAYGGDDSALPNVAGVPTVGPVDPTVTVPVWAVASTSAATSTGTSAVTFRVTSVAQPTYFQDLATTVEVATTCTSAPTPTATPEPEPSSTGVPPATPTQCLTTVPTTLPAASSSGGLTPTSYYLANRSVNADNTVASSPLTIRRLVAPTTTTLWNYATDLSGGTPGRYLAPTGSSLETTLEWRYQFGTATQLVGDGVTSLWAAPVSGNAADPMQITVTVKRLSSAGVVQESLTAGTAGSLTAAWGCAGFQQLGVPVAFGNGQGTKFGANEYLSVTVAVAGSPALVGYDTTLFQSAVVLPVKGGGQ